MSTVATFLRRYRIELILLAGLAAATAFFAYLGYGLARPVEDELVFSGERAYTQAEAQMAFGPRITGSDASRQMGNWLIGELRDLGWDVYIQNFNPRPDVSARNIIAVSGQGRAAILGAHYDSRMVADMDPDPTRRQEPVPGANDGASGVAVLLELARTLNLAKIDRAVCLVFFDAEDNGRLPGWDWILGSRYFVENLPGVPGCHPPAFAVIVDMVGDADQQLYREQNSTPELVDAIWATAAQLGYSQWFIDQPRYRILDDHVPFLEAGIPAADIIDFDYPYWHTTQDTLDKIGPESLERVGRTLETWLEAGAVFPPTTP